MNICHRAKCEIKRLSRVWGVWCLFLIFQEVASATLPCNLIYSFVGFGTEISSNEAEVFYQELWKQLGSEVDSKTIEEMLKQENLFKLPQDKNLNGETLRDGLKQFEDLLILAGKNTSEVKGTLLQVLRRRLEEITQTQTKETRTEREAILPGRVPRSTKPEMYSIEVDSKGEFLLAGSSAGGMLISTDWKNFRLWPSSHKPDDRVQNFKVSNDGKYVYYTAAEGQNRHFYRAKIRNENGKLVEKLEPELWLERSFNRGGTSWMYGSTFSEDGKFLVTRDDLGLYLMSTEKPATKELKPLIPGTSRGLVAGFIPNTNEIVVLTAGSIKYFKPDGTSARPDLAAKWGDFDSNAFRSSSLILTPDAKKAYVVLAFQLIELNLENGIATLSQPVNEKLYPPVLHNADFVRRVSDVIMAPTGEYLFILSGSVIRPGHFHPSPDDPARVLTFELKTGKVVQENLLSHDTPGSLYYIPGHNALLIDYPRLKEYTVIPKDLWMP